MCGVDLCVFRWSYRAESLSATIPIKIDKIIYLIRVLGPSPDNNSRSQHVDIHPHNFHSPAVFVTSVLCVSRETSRTNPPSARSSLSSVTAALTSSPAMELLTSRGCMTSTNSALQHWSKLPSGSPQKSSGALLCVPHGAPGAVMVILGSARCRLG